MSLWQYRNFLFWNEAGLVYVMTHGTQLIVWQRSFDDLGLTDWGRHKMTAISQKAFLIDSFYKDVWCILTQLKLKFVPKGLTDKKSTLGDKPLFTDAYMCQPASISNSLTYYSDVIISVMASEITGVSIACSTVYSGADQRKHQCSASLAFVRGIHRWPVDSPHKGSVTRKIFPFDDVMMFFY